MCMHVVRPGQLIQTCILYASGLWNEPLHMYTYTYRSDLSANMSTFQNLISIYDKGL